MGNDPILLEDYFNPGLKNKPGVFEGSQTLKFWHHSPEEQSWEGVYLAGCSKNDLGIVRDIDPVYIDYWKSLMDHPKVLNIENKDPGEYLTQIILNNQNLIKEIQHEMHSDSQLMVFLPTEIEEKLAHELHIALHGSAKISNLYGTKNGIRELASDADISMPQGFICSNLHQIKTAIEILKNNFSEIVIKHAHSASGYYSQKFQVSKLGNVEDRLREILKRDFIEIEDIVVVEGWLKSKASLCAHIEILEGQDPIVCAGWQQKIGEDGISYQGAGPLMISKKAFQSFNLQVKKLADTLKQKGAIGSFGPDFLVVSNDEVNAEPDTCVLIELNARAPYTAFPLEIVKQIKGKIGHGFFSQHIKLSKATNFTEVSNALKKEDLFITRKDANARGVVLYNTGLLNWGILDMVAMGDSWEETLDIVRKVDMIFKY